MKIRRENFAGCKHGSAFALLFILIFLIYSNTFDASWHLDDYHNIFQNPRLKISDLQPESIRQTFYASHDRGLYLGSKLYRPLPMMTFALNWYFGQDNVFGYHLVNISVHFLTAFILFLVVLDLFETPNLKGAYADSQYFLALLCASLWAINPIQTQAVTYIVQRMAAMATLFYVLGIYFYIKGRRIDDLPKQIFFYLGCGLSFIFALGSKQNAATMPIALVFVEFIFFRDMGDANTRKVFVGVIGLTGVAVLIGGIVLFFSGNPLGVFSYGNRFFSPLQRVITEPRILVYYLTQIFYPVPTRLSIEHDVTISTSLLHPWSTLPAIIIVLLLIGVGFAQMRRRPFLSFAILFFFLNHLIESTIVGLELAFEHRNYLPTLFLFLPVATGFKSALDYYDRRNPGMHRILAGFMTLLIIGLGCGTYVRNLAWSTEKSLWEDAMNKAPGSNRPVHNLAWGYFEQIGRFDKAMALYRKGLELRTHNTLHKSLTLNNIARLYYMKKDYPQAARLWQQAFDIKPDFEMIQYWLALALAKAGELAEADDHINALLEKRPEHAVYNYLKGSILLQQQQYEQAHFFYRKVLKEEPNLKMAMVKMGIVLYLMEAYERAEMFLLGAHARDPKDTSTLLWLLATYIKLENEMAADRCIHKLFALTPFNSLIDTLDEISANDLVISSQQGVLLPEITKKIKQRIGEINPLEAVPASHPR